MTETRAHRAPTSSLLLMLLFCGCAGGTDLGVRSSESSLNPRWRSASLRLLVLNGQEDHENRYLSTVLVDGTGQQGPCTGILIHPLLVLTAAHCVCPSTGRSLDSKRCLQTTTVTEYTYRQEQKKYSMVPRSRRGTVQPHASFTVQHDDEGIVQASTSDLAVIFLENALDGTNLGFELARVEPDVHDEVVVVGYGRTERNETRRRFFGKNNVTDKGRSNLTNRADKDVSLLFEMSGAHVSDGDSGGPCFVEDGKKRWLVGITAQGNGTTSRFTSLYRHLSWLNEQLEKARQKRL